MDDVIVFMRWQAEGSSFAVTLEPLPAHLPTDILADLRWLREDLMCVAANALKFSRERSMVPVLVRLTIDVNDDDLKPMLTFSFIDSGRKLSNDRLLTLFDHPKVLSNERMGMGGMGLGLYCLRERVTAMSGRCGARIRRDGLEGTEIWFCIPLLSADLKVKTFELQDHSSPHSQAHAFDQLQVEVIGKNAAAVMMVSSGLEDRTSNAAEFVTALGGSRRSSSSSTHRDRLSHKDSSYVYSKTNHLIGGTFDGIGDNEAIRSGRSAYTALLSNKTTQPQPPITKSSIELARKSWKSTDPSPIASLKQALGRVREDKGGMVLPILIVDDSIAILKMTKRSIINELPDLVVKEARDGNEAFDRVQEELNGFHVIITDIQMPECNGFEFTRLVREFENRNSSPPAMIIGISANYQEKIVEESQTCGMDAFMHKPFQLQTLLDVINHVQFHRDLTKQTDLHKDSSGSLHPQVIDYFLLTLHTIYTYFLNQFSDSLLYPLICLVHSLAYIDLKITFHTTHTVPFKSFPPLIKENNWKTATAVSRESTGEADMLSPTTISVLSDKVFPANSSSIAPTDATGSHEQQPAVPAVIAVPSSSPTMLAPSIKTAADTTSRPTATDRTGDIVNNNATGKQALQSSTEDEDQDLAFPLKNVRMLVVDDSVPILKMMCMTLDKRGKALITQAKDGLEAVNRCESAIAGGGQDFSVILTDIQMPNLDGMGEARRVRAMEKELGLEPKIIVGISAYSGDRIGIEAMEAGMDAFLPKPFKYETFESTVQEIVQRRKNVAEQVGGTENDVLLFVSDSASELKPLQQPVVVTPPGSRRIFPEA